MPANHLLSLSNFPIQLHQVRGVYRLILRVTRPRRAAFRRIPKLAAPDNLRFLRRRAQRSEMPLAEVGPCAHAEYRGWSRVLADRQGPADRAILLPAIL